MKHVFIVNPAAGGGESESVYLPRILKLVKEENVDYEIHRSLNKTDVTNWVHQRAAKGDAVRFYACGGDGTINDVMSGMVGCPNAELAFIPCGTGNDFVRNFSNTENFKDLRKLLHGESVPVDVISYGESYAMNMLNIGADCDVVVEVAKLKEKIKGSASYAIAAVKVLTKEPRYKMVYTVNGEEHEEDFLLAAIGNGRFCGGGFRSCPAASLQDGKMDVCIARPVPGLKVVPLMLKYRKGQHYNNPDLAHYIEYFQCESFRLKAKEPVNCSKDGEVELFEEAEFKVLPNAVKVVIPEGSKLL